MKHRSGLDTQCAVLDAAPGFSQIGNVFGKFGIQRVFSIRPKDEPATQITRQHVHPLAQLIALLGRDFLGYTDVVVLWQKDKQTPSNADLCCQAGTFGANRVF